MSDVYIVQRQTVGRDRPLFNFSHAGTFGRLVFLLGNDDSPGAPTRTAERLRLGLEDFRAEDYLVPVGSPALIAWAAAIAAQRTGGSLRLLLWDNGQRLYHPVECEDLFGQPRAPHSHEHHHSDYLTDALGAALERQTRHVCMVYSCTVLPDGSREGFNEEFTVDGEMATYADLVDKFGAAAVERFVEDATSREEMCSECT